jgi:hypothetical protein
LKELPYKDKRRHPLLWLEIKLHIPIPQLQSNFSFKSILTSKENLAVYFFPHFQARFALKSTLNMQTLSVVLLATLFPTLLIILILSGLSIYLFVQLRAAISRVSTAEIPPAVEEPKPDPLQIVEFFNPRKRYFLGYTLFFKPWEGAPFNIDNTEWFQQPLSFFSMQAIDRESRISDWDDTEVGEILKALGYEVMPPASFLRLLRDPKTTKLLLEHLVYNVIFRRTSLEGDPHKSYLPFTVQQHEDLRAYFDSLNNVKCMSRNP